MAVLAFIAGLSFRKRHLGQCKNYLPINLIILGCAESVFINIVNCCPSNIYVICAFSVFSFIPLIFILCFSLSIYHSISHLLLYINLFISLSINSFPFLLLGLTYNFIFSFIFSINSHCQYPLSANNIKPSISSNIISAWSTSLLFPISKSNNTFASYNR
ncbi:hypothetical protein THA_1539 [Thermosipho africanus TCF52B]|uniref:Uncharacterized protein n=1 Tax=Thermosipho africanus (strain TCF52B) TaxID=484019 RepID=B7IDA3_THEAB|nr:hypothetical protein THA_1539 [Thermosipho africanus TCF52B]